MVKIKDKKKIFNENATIFMFYQLKEFVYFIVDSAYIWS